MIAAGECQRPGDDRRPALEDLLGAGAILAALAADADPAALSPEAGGAVAAFESVRHRLDQVLGECASGRELRAAAIGTAGGADVELAAGLDVSRAVPRLDEGAFTAATVRP